jgi:hypothetical protein
VSQDLFVAKDCDKGYYRCKFYKDGKWKTVDVDDRLPCIEVNKYASSRSFIYIYLINNSEYVLYYGSCKDKSEFWVPILEKGTLII